MGKPYSFIPLLGKKSYRVNKEELYRGRMKLRIKTLTPLYVCRAEVWQLNNNTLRKSFYKVNGEYLIPGSSYKGVARSMAECVSHSCIKTIQKKYMIKEESVSNNKCECIVCKTFGKMQYKSKVVFRDFKLENKEDKVYSERVPKLKNPNPEINEYKENGKFKGVKLYHHGINEIIERGSIPVEAIKPNSYFIGEVLFDGIDIKQLELLCFCCGLEDNIQLKLGYNKPGYFGSCDVEVMEAYIGSVDSLDVLEKMFSPKEFASKWGTEDDDILENINKVKEILDYKNAKRISAWRTDKGGNRVY